MHKYCAPYSIHFYSTYNNSLYNTHDDNKKNVFKIQFYVENPRKITVVAVSELRYNIIIYIMHVHIQWSRL